ncbi:MAG: DUF6457 domain-containing protein [Actinomycetota bacterium]
MGEWIERFAEALGSGLEGSEGELGLRDEEVDRVLELARDIAHATERVNAPLSTYMAGRYVALREGQGADRATALQEAIEAARRSLKESESTQ